MKEQQQQQQQQHFVIFRLDRDSLAQILSISNEMEKSFNLQKFANHLFSSKIYFFGKKSNTNKIQVQGIKNCTSL
jgi:hypothetical protein